MVHLMYGKGVGPGGSGCGLLGFLLGHMAAKTNTITKTMMIEEIMVK